jgi:hypothetical protein
MTSQNQRSWDGRPALSGRRTSGAAGRPIESLRLMAVLRCVRRRGRDRQIVEAAGHQRQSSSGSLNVQDGFFAAETPSRNCHGCRFMIGITGAGLSHFIL